MDNPDLAALWEQRIVEQEASGMSIAEWCREHSISRHQCFYWRNKLGFHQPQQADNKRSLPVKWVPFADECRNHSYSVQVNAISVHVGPARLEVIREFDPETLRKIVLVLKDL